MKRNLALGLLAAALPFLALSIGGPAHADVALVTSVAALGPNDLIDWGQLGPDGTWITSTSVNVTSQFGRAATATTTDADGFLRLEQDPLSWPGNFNPGDHLLTTFNESYFPLTIDFAKAVQGAGTNIQLDAYGPFVATIEAFAGSTSLGAFTLAGDSNDQADGSAIFIGVLSTKADITRVVFGIQNPPAVAGDFVVNSVRILAVPEPSLYALSCVGGLLVLAGGVLRRRGRS